VARVAAAPGSSLAVTTGGTVLFWGKQRYSDGTVRAAPTPTPVAGLPPDVVGVAAGRAHGLAVTAGGEAWAWGENSYGQLGVGETTGRPAEPRRVPGLEAVVAVAAGREYSVALTGDGAVWAWGLNGYGATGQPASLRVVRPVRVEGLPAIAEVAAGEGHVVARATDGTVWAWGRNDSGQLGDGTRVSRAVARPVAGVAGARAVAAGTYHSLALGGAGELWGWGGNGRGQLATTAAATPDRLTAARIPGVPAASRIAAGATFSLALGVDGKLWAFGDGAAGQLGDDSFAEAPRDFPNTVVGFGRYRTLVLTQNGDTLRTGANLRETTLTADGVNGARFGRVAEVPVQGRIVAQPLYVPGVATPRGPRDVLYIATAENWLYAFDAATLRAGVTPQTIWTPRGPEYFGPAFSKVRVTGAADYFGIVSTPVIDLAAGTIFLVAKSDRTTAASTASEAHFHLHAFDLATGQARPGSPVRIEARVPGNARIVFPPEAFPQDPARYVDPRLTTGNAGYALDGTRRRDATGALVPEEVVFEAYLQFQRPGLLLQDGQVYLGFGGIDDLIPYHGWLLAYDARTLRQTGAYVTTPNGTTGVRADEIAWWIDRTQPGSSCNGGTASGFTCGFAYGQGGGVWQASNGLAGTGTGDVYLATGNSVDEAAPPRAFSNAMLRVGRDAAGALTTRTYFQPSDTDLRDDTDQDFGSGGPLLLPGTEMLFVGGKRGRAYVLGRRDMGGYTSHCGAWDRPTMQDGLFSSPVTSATPTGWFDCEDGALGGLQITRATVRSVTTATGVQTVPATATPDIAHGAVYWAGPAGPRVYVAPGASDVRVLSVGSSGALTTVEHAPTSFDIVPQESQLAISANGAAARSGVLWQLGTACGGRGAFVAFDASNVAAGPIWSSGQDVTPFGWQNSRFSGITVATGAPTWPRRRSRATRRAPPTSCWCTARCRARRH
jgi:hypothetical protein